MKLIGSISLALILALGVIAQDKADFKEVDLGFMKMTIPAGLIDQKVKGIDGGFWEFVGDGLTLRVDKNIDCWRPTFEKQDPKYDYSEELLEIDGIRAQIFNLHKGYVMAGANYGIAKDGKIGLGIFLTGIGDVKEKTKEIGQKIFMSVKFKSKETK